MKLSRKVPLNALRVFEAVARHGSFSRAADELGMTQTAVSYQIKLLEGHIGDQLFLRQPRQIVNTETAERMLPSVVKAFDFLGEAMALAQQTASETLEIHSSPTFASHWLARNLGAFQLEHPGIAVRLLRVSKITDFNRDPADVAIRWGVGPWPDLECQLLGRFTYAPMLSPALAASIGGVNQPSDLLKLPIIGAQQEAWQHWFAAMGEAIPDLTSHKQHNYIEQDLSGNAALAGQGVAMLNHIYYPDELASGRLVAPFHTPSGDDVGVWLVYPHSRRNTPKIKAFREWITAAVAADRLRTEPAMPDNPDA
ncbi:Transcriptional regulator [Hoeflea phototrophica DFL-43]|uniref:Transcriptional regulator n=1 Tax=Hoeflea phototrophica (strain DSM 17068 / NCIMB 14078 / DFL-43) TaxID=411684 RepID=A9DG54_HOEPD|nr:LysR substrate-binding domain-containing protein [Hoeflea phototrophica]EDQ31722.1 Transcriptional regulator [Hoeflea phototrophica DFL-43]